MPVNLSLCRTHSACVECKLVGPARVMHSVCVILTGRDGSPKYGSHTTGHTVRSSGRFIFCSYKFVREQFKLPATMPAECWLGRIPIRPGTWTMSASTLPEPPVDVLLSKSNLQQPKTILNPHSYMGPKRRSLGGFLSVPFGSSRLLFGKKDFHAEH